MNAGPDVERLLSDWLVEEAPRGAPDRIAPRPPATDIDHTEPAARSASPGGSRA